MKPKHSFNDHNYNLQRIKAFFDFEKEIFVNFDEIGIDETPEGNDQIAINQVRSFVSGIYNTKSFNSSIPNSFGSNNPDRLVSQLMN